MYKMNKFLSNLSSVMLGITGERSDTGMKGELISNGSQNVFA